MSEEHSVPHASLVLQTIDGMGGCSAYVFGYAGPTCWNLNVGAELCCAVLCGCAVLCCAVSIVSIKQCVVLAACSLIPPCDSALAHSVAPWLLPPPPPRPTTT
jgi:hypothetical protein